ncbi:hypothetical protein JCM9157_1505 [Halalkalibacter akibai JCM 9157]|uniref:Uncharacterized protein n=1 Tax=Halalkalibacter akibai (strain ATCC 43226 / DSM 21942 / CIP 109018 / JCM 9157 / 1139) TaxID=1236973 RepID=W4QT21_HALA3|nr:hypothetical protein JCM9157_1505 [Halalkalibacter akibai JCM 9157]
MCSVTLGSYIYSDKVTETTTWLSKITFEWGLMGTITNAMVKNVFHHVDPM